jgi:PTH1 family peptidyl-tRNA hydrolase
MHYIVALGNPGEKYADTRHNVGWLALTHCLAQWQLPEPISSAAFSGLVSEGEVCGIAIKTLCPTTFMNNSGSAVVKLVPKKEIERLIVVHDDIDVPFGKIKLGKGRGAGGNKGVQSIIDAEGSNEFVRVRVGIAPKSFWTGKIKRPAGGGPLERFVLKPFTSSEQKQLEEVFKKVAAAIETVITDGAMVAMNRYN